MNVGLAVQNLTLALGAFRLKQLDLALGPGEILVMLGPNGSGKSVTLETIAGFHRPGSGRILIGERDVTTLPPERRNVGFVVQNFGLFPHLTVAQNIAIAHRRERRGVGSDAALPSPPEPRALLDYFGIAHLAGRPPQDLSPGEKQRAALARALAGAPDLFLFDEPFSALDAQTRDALRGELLSFLRTLGIPALFVTHDHSDAMALADRVVVLRDGAMVQSGFTADIFQKPVNTFVARFVGVENVLPVQIVEIAENHATVVVGERTLRTSAPLATAAPGKAYASIRAENVRLGHAHPAPPPAAVNCLGGRVVGLRSIGPLVTVEIDCGFPLKAYLLAPQARDMGLGGGDAITVEIAVEMIHLMTA